MLVTLAAMKNKLGISDGSQDSFLLEQIILISETIENYCRRKFEALNWEQTFYAKDMRGKTNILTLYMFPVISITTIVKDTTGTITDYRLHKPTGIFTPDDECLTWSDKLVITYQAGFATVPTPIQEAVFSLVTERYNKKVSGVDLSFGSDIQRVSIPGTMSIDFDYTLQNNERNNAFGVILGNWANVLDFYRSERVLLGSGDLKYVETI